MSLRRTVKTAILAAGSLLLSLPNCGIAIVQKAPILTTPAHTTTPVPSAEVTPFLVFVHSKQCNVCAKVRPILQELEKTYKNKVQFIYLDVTDDKTKEESRKLAKSLSLGAFFAFYEDTYPCVGIFNSKKKCLKELYGYHEQDKYTAALDKAIASQ